LQWEDNKLIQTLHFFVSISEKNVYREILHKQKGLHLYIAR